MGGDSDNLLLQDVLIQILMLLPVMSLLRFKSVCKSWRAIIESPLFINLHTATTSLPSPSSSKLGVANSFVFNCNQKHEEEEKKRDNIFKISGEEFEVFEDLGRPPLMDLDEESKVLIDKYKILNLRFRVVGCCNGIICLHEYFSRNIILWNPAIKQSRTLPKPSNLLGNSNCFDRSYDDVCYADDFVIFGVDVKTMDYKVLLLTTLELLPDYGTDRDDDDDDDDDDEYYNYQEKLFMRSRYLRERRAHVYSLSTDSWRCIDATLSADHPYLQISKNVNGGYYLNGSHFFMTFYMNKFQELEDFYSYSYMPLIMSFDFTEEIFRSIQPPFNDMKERYSSGCSNHFIQFGEKLALAVDVTVDDDNMMTQRSKLEWDVWVLNEQQDGVKESWTKFYSTFGNSNSYMVLQCIANNGQFAIIYGEISGVFKLVLLNLITGETKELQFNSQSKDESHLNVRIYKPSLVQVGRGGATTNEKCDSTL